MTHAATTLPVVIIGAGFAGLSAAAELRRRGVTAVVLEARDRVGGRVWTRHDLAADAVQLGAEFVHNRENPVGDLLRSRGIPVEDFALPSEEHSSISTDAPEWTEILERGAAVQRRDDLASFVAGLDDEDRDRLAPFLEFWRERDTPEQTSLVHTLDEIEKNREHGEMMGGHDYLVPDAWSPAIAHLLDGVDVRLSSVVERIEWSADSVRVTYADPAGAQEIVARRAIVTLPLGVLKAGSVVFEPSLPDPTRRAIAELGLLDVAKTLFVVDGDRWPWSDPYGPPDAAAIGGAYLSNWFVAERRDTVVGFWAAGAQARRLLALEQSELIAHGTASLQRLLGERVEPRHAVIHNWMSDPFTRGAYSHARPGTPADVRERLAAPDGSTLFWAGEATASYRPRTVQGAYTSGIRAAREAFDSLS